MGKRNRERIKRIRQGLETPIAEQKRLEALERIAEEFGGETTAEELRRLSAEGRLIIGGRGR